MRYKKRTIAGVTYQEHRLVWEKANGPIPDGFVVHHLNEDKLDNRLENLGIMAAGEHSRHHNQRVHPLVKICEVCGQSYEPHITKRKRAKTCSWACRNELIRRASLVREANRRASRHD